MVKETYLMVQIVCPSVRREIIKCCEKNLPCSPNVIFCVQVPESTAMILESAGYTLVFRGKTTVKGKAPMNTSFLLPQHAPPTETSL